MSKETKSGCGIETTLKYDRVRQEDVEEIESPAYVVKEPKKKQGGEEDGSGCIVEWNEAFENLTNFVLTDIDNKPCYKLIEAVQQRTDTKTYVSLCLRACRFRTGNDREKSPVSLRNVWINSKDRKGNDIKRLVDILIFPFETDDNIFALHILFDKKRRHEKQYFENDIVKENLHSDHQPQG